MTKKVSYLAITLKFSIASFFLAVLPVFVALGFQLILTGLGADCNKAWTIIWTISWTGMIITPILFARRIRRRGLAGFHLPSQAVTFFNIIQYSFIQWSLASILTSGKTLCYVTDGQNGIEFIFTGWMAIPVLLALSLFFDFVKRKTQEDLYNIHNS
ncbi:MAG TPA: hypothetical protein VL728_17805 [Cyclobacteriaceae bacterium]|jgi:hypothetical protein|nr:hypothetical protein [Cyclobacteriaceae bacterium]